MISNTCSSDLSFSIDIDIDIDDSSKKPEHGGPRCESRSDQPQRLLDGEQQSCSIQQPRATVPSAGPIALRNNPRSKASHVARTGFDLIRAAKENRLEQLQAEIGMHANIEHVDEDEMNAIMYAALNGNLVMVKALIDAGADANKCNAQGETALMLAVAGGHRDIIELLVKFADFIDVNDKQGATALAKAVVAGDVAIVRLLLQQKAYIEGTDNKGFTPLSLAASHGHMDIVNLLLENRADINTRDKHRMDALMLAASRGHTGIVKLLIDKGADIKARNTTGLDALMLAALRNRADTVQLLLTMGADPASKTRKGITALMLAAANGSTDTVKLLVKHGAQMEDMHLGKTALLMATEKGHHETVKVLLENGAATETGNSQGTALLIASLNGHTATVEVLLEKGKDVAIDANDEAGRTALMLAALGGHTDIVKLLLKHGATIRAEAQRGWNALNLAIKNGRIDAVELLLENLDKTDINMAKHDGFTPLMLAGANGYTAIVKLLLGMGANPDAVDQNSQTAFMHAANNGKYDTAMYMMNCRGGVDVCLAMAAGMNNVNLIESIGRMLSMAPNYHPRDAARMIEHAIVDLNLAGNVIGHLVKGGLIPTKSDRKVLMEISDVRRAIRLKNRYINDSRSFLQWGESNALIFSEYRAGDHPQVDKLVDAPAASLQNLLGMKDSQVEIALNRGHLTDAGGIYRHQIGTMCDSAVVRFRGGSVEHRMLEAGWRSGITSLLDQARKAAALSARQIAAILSSKSQAFNLTDMSGRQVEVNDIRMKDTLFAFELARNEPLNQLAYPERMLPAVVVDARKATSHVQAKAVLELNSNYVPLRLEMPALSKAKRLEAAVGKNRLSREQALTEVEQGLLQANAFFFDATTELHADLARHWIVSQMTAIITELEAIRTSLGTAVLV